jgi:inosine-uridine nucleoside N-ribohydrolase
MLLQTVHVNVEVETASQYCDGRTVVDRWRATSKEPNAHVAVGVDAERFLELLCSRIESLA